MSIRSDRRLAPAGRPGAAVSARPPVLLALILALAACRGPAAGPPSTAADRFDGSAEATCSPVDATAVGFNLRPESDRELPQISLVLWPYGGISEGARVRFDKPENGYAAAWVAGTEWTPATDGELQLDSYREGGSAAGWFWLELSDGSRLEGWFEADWLDQGPVMCG